MSAEIAKRQSAEVERAQPTNMLEAVMEAVRDPNMDPARLEHFLAIGRQLQEDQAKAQYNAAFARLKMELPVIAKNGVVLNKAGKVQFKYARYDDLHRAITPLLNRYGFATSFDFEEPEKGRLTTILHLLHQGGFQRDYRWTLPAMGDNQYVTNLQNAAAARSFGKRCVLIDALDILTEDTDSDGAPVAAPDRITEGQSLQVEEILDACEDKSPGTRKRFAAWLKAEMKAERPSDLFQGEQYDRVIKKLKATMVTLGVA